jgi:putative IMPACT (imprinted ancient) family translation regulator
VNCRESVAGKLKKFRREDIIITDHALGQAVVRGLDSNEIKENTLNHVRLEYAILQEAENAGEEKFDCFFSYGEMMCHRYIIAINHKCFVCTVMKIMRRWRNIAEKNAQAQV